MVKKSKKSKSKRVPLRKKYKIIRKVKEHHKKKAKEAKKLGLNRKQKVEKDPGIPNDWPFKEQELKALETRRARALEELEQKKAARKERAHKRKLGLLEDANAGEPEHTSVCKNFVDGSGQETMSSSKNHDLVPREAVEKWLKYLREELPAVAFKCSTQAQRSNLGWKSTSKAAKQSNALQTSDCLGAETLIRLLKNYSRSHEIKMSITVGIVGLPNVGKSSLINSLKRSHVVNVGATPGLTRSMQEVHLDKKVKLLDCPGVVMVRSGGNDTSIVLRNCKRIEKLDDPVTPVKEILRLCPAERLMSLYKLPKFSSVDDFLQKVASIRGKLKKGGILDTEAAARIVLHDWNEGKIHYYTLPPVRNEGENLELSIVGEFGKEFNVDEVYQTESSFIGSLVSVEDFRHVEVPPGSPLNFDGEMTPEDDMGVDAVQNADESIPCDEDHPEEANSNSSSRQNDKLYNAEGILDPRNRRAEKKRRKAQKSNLLNAMDADYDFKVDYFRKEPAPEVDVETPDGSSDEDKDASGEAPMVGVELDA